MEWYKIRDLVTGRNYVNQNIPKALKLAKKGTGWFSDMCREWGIVNKDHLIHALKIEGENNDEALVLFLYLSQWRSDVYRNAAKTSPFAQTLMGTFEMYLKSANSGERDGFSGLGWYYTRNNDRVKAKENFLKAANLGNVYAMFGLARLQTINTMECWFWFGKAALLGAKCDFIEEVKHCKQVQTNFDSPVKYEIGRICYLIGHSSEYEDFYRRNRVRTLWAVREWTHCAIRMNVCKDMRKYIGEFIWSTRVWGNY